MTDATTCAAGQQQHLRNHSKARPPHTQCCCHKAQHQTDCPDKACPGCIPARANHGQLCAGCYSRLANAIDDIAGLHADLAEKLPPGSAAGQAKVSGTPEKRLGITVPIVDHRLLIEGSLADNIDCHADEGGFHPPHNKRHPATAAPWLRTHLDWACQQPWADDYALELPALVRRARQLLNPSGHRRITEIGPCPEDDCPGSLTAHLAPADELLPTELTCSANDEHTFNTTQWRRLGRRIHKKEDAA